MFTFNTGPAWFWITAVISAFVGFFSTLYMIFLGFNWILNHVHFI